MMSNFSQCANAQIQNSNKAGLHSGRRIYIGKQMQLGKLGSGIPQKSISGCFEARKRIWRGSCLSKAFCLQIGEDFSLRF